MAKLNRPEPGDRATNGILLVIPWELRHVGGVNEVVKNLAREANENGYRAIVFENLSGFTRPIYSTQNGIDIVKCTITSRPPSAGSAKQLVGYWLKNSYQKALLRRFLKIFNIKLVSLHYEVLAGETFIKCQPGPRRIPVLLSFHGRDIDSLNENVPIDPTRWSEVMALADGITVCSRALKRDLVLATGISSDEVEVIYNGVSPAVIDLALSGTDGRTTDYRYLICVATFEQKKGQRILLEAFSKVRARFPDLRLLLVGRDTPYRNTIEEEIDRRDLRSAITVHVDLPHAETMRLLKHAKALVLPSIREPFGIVLTEAGYLGVPVVASDVGGIPEVLDDGRCGSLVNPEDPDALAAAMIEVIDREASSAQKASLLRERVLRNFTWEEQAKKYLQYAAR